MKTTKPLCFIAIVLMLVFCVGCARSTIEIADTPHVLASPSVNFGTVTLSTSDGTVALTTETDSDTLAGTDAETESNDEKSGTKTAGIILLSVAGVGLVAGVAMKIIQKKKN